MVTIIKIVNTMCFIYILTNQKMRTLLLNTIYVVYSFLLKEIDDGFKRQDEFIHHLVTELFQHKNVKENIVTVTDTNTITDEKPEEKEKEKIEEKFEDKYLQRFKTFKNEYSFTETELELEKQKYDELKKTFVDDKNKAIEEINNKINSFEKLKFVLSNKIGGSLNNITFNDKNHMFGNNIQNGNFFYEVSDDLMYYKDDDTNKIVELKNSYTNIYSSVSTVVPRSS